MVKTAGESDRGMARIYSGGFQVTIKSYRERSLSMRKGSWAVSVISMILVLATMLAGGMPLVAAERGEQLAFGVEMARRGLWAEALFRFKRAAQEDPGNPKIMNNLAVAHEAVGEFDKALELYREAVELEPSNAELKRNYARFVEFYQSFRPRDKDAEDGEKAAGSKAVTDEGEEGG